MMAVSTTTSLDDINVEVMMNGTDDYSCMEQWLDSHPDFVQGYIAKKVKQVGLIGLNHNDQHSPSQLPRDPATITTPGPRCGCAEVPKKPPSSDNCTTSTATGTLPAPVTSTIKCTSLNSDMATSTTLSTSPSEAPGMGPNEPKAPLDEREFMCELVADICQGLDVTMLCHKILQNVGVLLNAARCSLFLLRGESESPERCLVSKLFDVSHDSTWKECSGVEREVSTPWGQGIVGHVAKTGETVNVPDAYMVSDVLWAGTRSACYQLLLVLSSSPVRGHHSGFSISFGHILCLLLGHFNHCHVLSHCIHKPPFRPSQFPLSWHQLCCLVQQPCKSIFSIIKGEKRS